jgi:DNA replication and repair protein RecF
MYISKVKLENYKNLNLDFEPSVELNLIIAPNGSGKTNLIEALYYFYKNSSFRGVSDDYVKPFSQDAGQIFSAIEIALKQEKEEREDTLRIVWDKSDKKTHLFNSNKTNSTKFRNNIKFLLHAPSSVDVVTGSAGNRRDFFDTSISLLEPKSKKLFRKYRKVLAQKNRFLKDNEPCFSLIGELKDATEVQIKDFYKKDNFGQRMKFWNDQVAQLTTQITFQRVSLLKELVPIMQKIAKKIYHQNNYQVGFELESKYLEKLTNVPVKFDKEVIKEAIKAKLDMNLSKEIISQRSLYGAHLDDYIFLLGGKNVRHAGSRGQQRLFSVILHFAFLELFEKRAKEKMIVLLDDVFSELDPEHRINTQKYILDKCAHHQTFITSPDESQINLQTEKYHHISLNSSEKPSS